MVRRSDASRPPLTSSWMSSLANVPSSEWIRRPGCATRVSSRKPRIDCESRVERRSIAGDRGRDPDGRSVWRDEAGLGRCEPRIDDLLERRRGRAIDVGRVGRHPREDVIDICGEGCVVQRSFRIADDEQRLVGRVLRPRRAEEVVRARRLVGRLLLAIVVDRVRCAGPAHRQAGDEEPDRQDEPEQDDRPPMACAPCGDAHGPRLSPRGHRVRPARPPSRRTLRRRGTGSRGRTGPLAAGARGAASRRCGHRSHRSGDRGRSHHR